jgi:hypothetical protein
MKTLARLMLAAVMLAGIATAAEATLRIGSVTTTRFGTSYTLDGARMAPTRAKLLNAANFGAAGIVANPITITDTAAAAGSVNAALLANFDVFFIAYLSDADADAFTPAELAAFQKWVYEGGTMVVTCDDGSHDTVCAYFGYPNNGDATPPTAVVPTFATHPLFSGPFGAVASIAMSGNYGSFVNTTGAYVLATDSNAAKRATILVRQFGAGKVVFLADVDMITDATLTDGNGIGNANDRFLGNLFAFAGSITPTVGLWWNPAESGSGYNIDIKHNVMVVTTYSYKANGDSEWYISTGTLVNNVFTGSLDKARNGQCIGCPYTGSGVLGGSDGAITIQFTSANSATAFLPGGRVVPIQPQPF